MQYLNKISFKKWESLDYVPFYEIKRTGFFNEAYLNLYDVNNEFVGTTKNYDYNKLINMLNKSSRCSYCI